ncbi:pyridoxamine 5'-phosphate oxidase family protein [Rhodococcus sp. HNM0569]|uniref:pyridoxamine 5'-phosphate oxidase family protein n=1 Tax=Rhodococcus sp. HNM0569 TaxID=2716340 RepID=UPI00146F49C6|nr:pyridoxamine 5'-phosphate oxidase family protein [Rhodococcus sp. HNM0569]NLU84812.1 pyridoxamine 5'-phosphate oxidase family protein [Rhodococcus sp. HNM0569]
MDGAGGMDGHVVTDAAELRALVGEPTERAKGKTRPALSAMHLEFLARSPLAMIATCDADGNMDVSPKGDPPGFAHVLDETHLAVPERPGNKRMDGFHNVLTDPRVATLWLVPGRGDTLRINGRARIVRDASYFDRCVVKGHRPSLALEIEVQQVFFHCSKAFMRSRAWEPESWNVEGLPSPAQIAKAFAPDASLAELEEYYTGPGYAESMYRGR